jgi:transcriptional regulator with XRE-family HTH domain
VSNKIKWLRVRSGLTQRQLAASLKTTQQTIARWESGKSEIPLAQLKELTVVLQHPVDEILGVESTGRTRGKKIFSAARQTDVPYGTLQLRLTVGERNYPVDERARKSVLHQLNRLHPQRGEHAEAWLYFWTLDNKIVFANAKAVKQFELIGDDVEAMPEWLHPEVYKALTDWDAPDLDIGEQLRSQCASVVRTMGADEARRSMTHARIVFLNAEEGWHAMLEEEDTLGYFSLESQPFNVAPNSFIEVESEGYYRSRYVCLSQVALIEVPAELYARLSSNESEEVLPEHSDSAKQPR